MTKGYKGMKQDMTCRGFKYEIGKTYRVNGDIKLCKNGLHFCKNLKDVFLFYGKSGGNRFFEVEGNVIESDEVKSVADELFIIRELTEEELNRGRYNDSGYIDYKGDGYGYGDGYGGVGRGNGYDGDDRGDGCGCGYRYGYGDGDGDGRGDGQGYTDTVRIEEILRFI